MIFIPTSHPDHMPPEARLGEAAAILASGVARLLEKRKMEKIPLDKSPAIRPHVRKTNRKGEGT